MAGILGITFIGSVTTRVTLNKWSAGGGDSSLNSKVGVGDVKDISSQAGEAAGKLAAASYSSGVDMAVHRCRDTYCRCRRHRSDCSSEASDEVESRGIRNSSGGLSIMPQPADVLVPGLATLREETVGHSSVVLAFIDGRVDTDHPSLAGAAIRAVDSGAPVGPAEGQTADQRHVRG